MYYTKFLVLFITAAGVREFESLRPRPMHLIAVQVVQCVLGCLSRINLNNIKRPPLSYNANQLPFDLCHKQIYRFYSY
jgi:hypothetical protein